MTRSLHHIGVVALGAVLCSTAAWALKSLGPGDAVSPLELRDRAGRARALSDAVGPKGALFVFWASWNPRSAEILAYYRDVHVKYRDRGLTIVPVNVEREGVDAGQAEALGVVYDGWELPWETLFDPGLEAFAAFGVITLPTSIYVGGDLKIAGVYPGFPAEAREALAELVEKGLGIWNPPVEVRRALAVSYVPKAGAGHRFQMGRLLHQKGQKRKALEEVRLAFERDPDFAMAGAALAYLLGSSGAEAQAEDVLRRLRDKAAADEGFREAHAVALVALRRPEEARPELELLLAGDEPRPRALVALAHQSYRQGDERGALRLLSRLKAWPVGGVPLEVDARPYLSDAPLQEQWKDVDAFRLRLLDFGPAAGQ